MNNQARLFRAPSGSRVAFQGELGAFSQQASLQIFGKSALPLPCPTFEDVFTCVSRRTADFAVIPIENSLAGSIHQNFDLLTTHPVDVIAETFVRIEHHLIGYAGMELSGIQQIYSHPAALAQCRKFLRRLRKVEVVSFYDTAGSVKCIRERSLKNAAAIASAHAAKIYGMKILRRNIEDDRENFTRFLALARHKRPNGGGEKTTIVFGLKNEPGALFKALSVFALRNIDLAKIESRPIHGKPWEYLFYIDILSGLHTQECVNALRHLREMTLYFKVLGSYSTIRGIPS